MTVDLAVIAFVAGAVVSLAMSWMLVSRLERVGERLGLSEALLGLLAALAADTPEITASVTAISHNQRTIGAGVVIGSNVFNLAALLGLGAVVAGRVGLHRKVVALGGAVAMWVAIACLGSVGGALSPLVGLCLVLVVLVPYVVVLGGHGAALRPAWLPSTWSAWLASAVDEEELELVVSVHPRRGRPKMPWWPSPP
jgi:cation:H+ antiporter